MKKKISPNHFNPLRRDIRFLTTILGDMMIQIEGRSFFNKVEEIRKLSKQIRHTQSRSLVAKQCRLIKSLSLEEAYKVARAFTIYFQLVNMAEEHHRVRRLRLNEQGPLERQDMSLRKLFCDLKSKKISGSDVSSFLKNADIELVLTAHPTETKRRTVLDQLLRIASDLDALDREMMSRWERENYIKNIRETVETLWLTSELRERKVGVLDEVDQTLFYFRKTILSLAPKIHDKITMEFEEAYPGVKFEVPPFIRFGSWVGGDRDGNPNVTPAITRETMKRQRDVIMTHYLNTASVCICDFSQSCRLVDVSDKLLHSIAKDQKGAPKLARALSAYEANEPYRKKFSYIYERILQARDGGSYAYTSSDELVRDLVLIQESLEVHGGIYTATGFLKHFIDQVKIFGFYLAPLDFRDHSGKIRHALKELLGSEPDESQLVQALGKVKPLSLNKKMSSVTKDLFDQLSVFKELVEQDQNAVGDYLISMTESTNDVLGMIYLSACAGLIKVSNGKIKSSNISIVPLFETIQSLRDSSSVMKRLFALPIYRSFLKARGNVQEIMLGYSDSNKNGGYLTANWELYLTQKYIGRMEGQHGIKIKLFHGKGGTIDRGGGASHRALLAQPFAATGGRIKITEQGEVISQKYSNFMIATRNLEQLITAVTWTNLVSKKELRTNKRVKEWEQQMAYLSQSAFEYYQDLVFKTDGFVEFYEQATPIQVVSMSKFSSRPAKRRKSANVEDLRAIPWVFSWIQSRYMVSSWYGVGHAFSEFAQLKQSGGIHLLQEMYEGWPFFKSLVDNVQTSLAKTDLYISNLYADLVSNAALKKRVVQKLKAEHQKTVKWVLRVTQQKKLLSTSPVLSESIRLRNPYVDPLNFIQIEYLKKVRSNAFLQANAEKKRKMADVLLLTLNGISFGMKSTG